MIVTLLRSLVQKKKENQQIRHVDPALFVRMEGSGITDQTIGSGSGKGIHGGMMRDDDLLRSMASKGGEVEMQRIDSEVGSEPKT